ncbi:hypothetical protein ABH926_006647 [Catenulispora sp. GP43]|uniref:hypothetical protein n=1 Tax=Catenulispora sp. GP43 TaxID=3156263 RepID=UPI0035164803
MDQRDSHSGQPDSTPTYAPPQSTYAPPQPTYAPPQSTYAPPQRASAPPQRTAQKPTVRRRTAILGSLGGLVLGLLIGAAGHSPSQTGDTAAGVPSTTAVTTTVTARNAAPAVAHTSAAAAPPPAPSTTAAPKPAVVFSTSGNGIKNTASFTTGAEWSVAYTFDCSGAGGDGKGNFVLDVGGDMGDILANALAASGSDTSYEHGNPGSHYLQVDSECDWTLKVSND